jgi:hypothetical protein
MYRRILVIGLAALFLSCFIQVAFSISEGNVEDFDQAAEKIRIIIEDEEIPVDWVTIHQAIQQIGIIKDPRAKELMAEILRRDVPLALLEGSAIPDVMPPLEMVKTAAIDILVDLNAEEYISEIQRIYESTQFKLLKDKAGEAIAILNK